MGLVFGLCGRHGDCGALDQISDTCREILAPFFKAVILIKGCRRRGQQHGFTTFGLDRCFADSRFHVATDFNIQPFKLHPKRRSLSPYHIGFDDGFSRQQSLKPALLSSAPW